MRDPNEIKGMDSQTWMRSTLASMKKLAEAPGSQPQSKTLDSVVKNPPVKGAIASDKAIKAGQIIEKKPGALPERKLMGAVDFTENKTLHSVDTGRFQRKFERQPRKDIKSTTGREGLVKSFVDNASASGRMTSRDAKRAILAAHDAGHITRRETRGLLKRFGI